MANRRPLPHPRGGCRQALAIAPNIYEAHNNIGMIYDKQGPTQQALKEFRQSLAIQPDQAAAHSQMGRIYMKSHQLPQAVEEFTQALRFNPASADAHNDQAWPCFNRAMMNKQPVSSATR